MNVKVGVFANGQVSGEVIKEAKEVLQELALKYKCRFELSRGSDEIKSAVKAEGRFKANTEKPAQPKNGVFLSFGGELEF